MIQEKPLSIADITQELKTGTATVKFILKRFEKYLPFERINGHNCYLRNTIPVLIRIKESLDAGMLPSEIDQELKHPDPEDGYKKTDLSFLEQPNEDIRVSRDGLGLIKSLFDDIALQQNRVAIAHEKRAEAEERKAIAIEKRAEAEEKKAIAMNNIANALKEMSRQRPHDSQSREMALQAVEVMAINETNMEIDLPEPRQKDISDIFDSPDDLPYDLLETDEIDMDDLSDLIEHVNEPEMDDLSTLLDDPKPQPDDLDDLSSLIDMVSPQTPSKIDVQTAPKLDDLSLLIQASSHSQNPSELDDLSLLIEPVAAMAQSPDEMDNLSLLIDSEVTAPDSQTPTDDLSALLDDKQETAESEKPMEDLNALIDQAPSLKPDITPEENLKEYKSVVMKIILSLKTEGLSAEESTRRLNQDGVQTISGKSQWSEKAILQIYKFIDSVK
ncbi:MAG: hypothetical protein KKF12_12070 [Proteobacteria bacterium]|nr:hypothetical protein [Desulfobacula sp.]MBU3951428.1 hypothetical protein [Pseudomonadota bacterium]MBU4131549.1 hypothetical protein [Pseudomonadota bacterium]